MGTKVLLTGKLFFFGQGALQEAGIYKAIPLLMSSFSLGFVRK